MIFEARNSENILFGFLLILCFIQLSICKEPPKITGKLSMTGTWFNTQKNKEFMGFLGIPYAKPMTQEKRFTDSEPYGELESNFDATTDGAHCPQPLGDGRNDKIMSENCLFLNVYTHNTNESKPVIFFIHGGTFITGGGQSSHYGPQYLLDNDIVLVTINYRLGPFGFLSTQTKDATGNYGLKDQVLALRWVHDNIKYFGGDPNSVTIFGQSAGAWSVTAHLASPMSAGLFHRVIAFSGSSTSAHFIKNVKWTQIVANKTKCLNTNTTEMINCLRKVDWTDIIKVIAEWKILDFTHISFGIEAELDFGQEIFLDNHPSVLLSQGNFSKVPILIGTTKNEFDMVPHVAVKSEKLLLSINSNFDAWTPLLFNFPDSSIKTVLAKDVKTFYFDNKNISKNNVEEFSQAFSDSTIIHSVHRLMQLARKYVDVYFYRFDYLGNRSIASNDKPQFVSHSDDLQYVFVMNWAPLTKEIDSKQFMVERMNKWIYNFAKNGNPNGDNKNGIKDSTCANWPKTNSEGVQTLYNDATCNVQPDEPYKERMKFWDDLFPTPNGVQMNTVHFPLLIGFFSIIIPATNKFL